MNDIANIRNKLKNIEEGHMIDKAAACEQDHEVEMARSQLYNIANYGMELHEMLKGISEADGLDGWVQAKITKAQDYLGSVKHHLEYQMMQKASDMAAQSDEIDIEMAADALDDVPMESTVDQIEEDVEVKEASADPKIVARFAKVRPSQRSYYIMKWAEEEGIDSDEAMEMAGYEKGSYMGAGAYRWRYVGEATKPEYNKDAVNKEIKKDPKIKGKEAKAIHALLKGRTAKTEDAAVGTIPAGESKEINFKTVYSDWSKK